MHVGRDREIPGKKNHLRLRHLPKTAIVSECPRVRDGWTGVLARSRSCVKNRLNLTPAGVVLHLFIELLRV